jgi:outer membrane protein TolC
MRPVKRLSGTKKDCRFLFSGEPAFDKLGLHNKINLPIFAGRGKRNARKRYDPLKRFYEQSLANTKNAVHARLSAQRKILATLRAMRLSMRPYRDAGH